MQVGGEPTKHTEPSKAPEIVEPTLKYMALTFRKTFSNSSEREVVQRLKDVIHAMNSVIKQKTRANVEALKWYLSLNMNFCKSTSPGVKTDPPITFRSEVLTFIDTQELDYQFHEAYNQIVQQIGEF